jgi:hypothetical protein
MTNRTVDSRSLRLSATLLLAGQLLYVVITLMHTGGEANNIPSFSRPTPAAKSGRPCTSPNSRA